jgi:tetratricopeptide (TPR) repeat protein
MKEIYLFTILLFLISCASEKVDSENTDQKEVPYLVQKDYFNIDGDNLLVHESVDIKELVESPDGDDFFFDISKDCANEKFKNARDQLSLFYVVYKKHPSYWNILGNCFYKDGNSEIAKLYYNRALESRRNYVPALNNLALLSFDNKRWNEGLELLKRGLKQKPDSQVLLYNLGLIFHKFGHFNKSNYFFSKLTDRKLKDLKVKRYLAINKFFQGNFKESVRLFEDLDSSVLKNHDKALMAFSYFQQKQITKAKEYATEVNLSNSHPYYRYLEQVNGVKK